MALLAGCTIYVEDPDPPPIAPPDWIRRRRRIPLHPPPDAELPPDSDPPTLPPPLGFNVSGDEYDAANHCLLVSDCPNSALLALDLATGERSFHSRERRLLLIEPIGGRDGCRNGVFAVDADTRAFTQVAERIE